MIFGTISLIVSLVLLFSDFAPALIVFCFFKEAFLTFKVWGSPGFHLGQQALCTLPWAVYFPRAPAFTYTPVASRASASVLAFLHTVWIHPSGHSVAFHVSGNELMMPLCHQYHPFCHPPAFTHFSTMAQRMSFEVTWAHIGIIATY